MDMRSAVEQEVRGREMLHQTCWEGVSLQKNVFIERGEMMHVQINGTRTVVRVTHQDGILVEVDRGDGSEPLSAAFSVVRT